MIVRQAGSSLELITQPDHAALARRVMERWGPLGDASRRAAILLAIGEHDNGWRELDAAPVVDPARGRIFDFIDAPAEMRQSVWPRGVANLAEHPWAAALVAQHALVIYDRYAADDRWTAFFDAMRDRRDRLVGAAGGSLADLLQDYVFVRVGDLISLIFCNGWREPLAAGEHTLQLESNRLVVRPDPFDGQEVPLVVTARRVPDVFYRSDAELRAALEAAPTVTIEGSAAGDAA